MGIPAPELKEEGNGFTVTYQKEYKNINNRQKKAVKYVSENGFITTKIYQDLTSASRTQSRRDIIKLCELKILMEKGNSTDTIYTFCKKF